MSRSSFERIPSNDSRRHCCAPWNDSKAKLDSAKDPGITFEATGIDYLAIDEGHGYTLVVEGQKVQRFQWDGYDVEYDWSATGADGSPLSAFHQIRRMTHGNSTDQGA
jgi:hypothetical protein